MVITVITVTKNCKESVVKTIDSVVRQNVAEASVEYILCDGNSTDGTYEIAKEYQNKYGCITTYSQLDSGIYDAMNKSMTYATGDYIIFLNSGDYFIDNSVLGKIITFCLENGLPDIVYGDIVTSDNNNCTIYKKSSFSWKSLIMANTICHQGIIAKKSLFDEYKFDLSFKYCADRDWIYHMYFGHKRFKHMNEFIVYYDADGFSSSDSARKAIVDERYRLQKKYCPLFLWVHKMIRSILRILNIDN